ncbi:MAG: chromosome segregation protein ScpA [Planctomycetota bacterium]|nr:MAG: chromosome segregation protein ScpA [Planctomycetota bacterium]
MRFRVQLDMYAGPLDLLLYLVKRNELEILEIPIARVADQYLEVLAVIEQIDVDAVGDFLEVATQLMEIKSRMMLPRHEDIEEEPLDDPRHELVQRLLDYKRYKEAASLLEERARDWQLRYARRVDDLEAGLASPATQPIAEVEIWDLVSAFSRVMREKSPDRAAKIRYDDTPIEVHMQRIAERIAAEGRFAFSTLFEPGMHRSRMVGLFLALLELVRHAKARCQQEDVFAEIWILPPAAPSEANSPAAAAAA